jgi:putative FmdB family regulatory protein
MPFYEYECSNCKFYTEVMQKITDAPLTKCPSCSKKALKKLVSAPNFRLKGGGWYETDFKGDKENKRNLAGAEKDDSSSKTETSASSTAESSKTEASKPEASKTESGTADSSSKPASASGGGGSSGAEPKSSAARRSSAGGRSAKPAARTAAPKAKPRPVAASRSKPKPAARKKARR